MSNYPLRALDSYSEENIPFGNQWRYGLFLLLAALLTLGAAWLTIIQDPLINTDGIFYLQLAYTYLTQGFSATYEIYQWLFYPLLIAWTHQLTGLSLSVAAYAVTAAFQVGLTLMFLHLVKTLGGNSKVICFALLTILLLPHLNEYRPYIIRDFGYCFFLLLSAYYFLHYIHTLSIYRAIGFVVAVITASLFRFEGFVFLLLMPFVVLVKSPSSLRRNLQALLKMLAIIGLFGITILLITYFASPSLPKKILAVFLVEKAFVGHSLLLRQQVMDIAQMMHEYWVAGSLKSATVFVICGLIGMYIHKLLYVLSALYAVIVAYTVKKQLMPVDRNQACVLWGYIAVNVAITVVFFTIYFFLSGRYVLPLTLFLLLWVPFGLAHLYEEWRYQLILRVRKHLWIFPLIMVALVYMAVDGLFSFGASKLYLKQSGAWLATNTPATTTIYTNEPQILYYARGLTPTWTQAVDDSLERWHTHEWQQYQYVAINVSKNNPALAVTLNAAPSLQLIKTFDNGEGSKVLIYTSRK